MKKGSKASLSFIFITILIDVIGIGIIVPVFPSLIQSLTGEGLSEASRYGGWLMLSYASMQFLFAPVMGELSDKYGRRPVILISLLGLGIDYVFHAFAPTLMWLFVGRLLAGVTGASFTTATAYIADISTPEKRAQNFGLIGAAFGLGFILGPVIGGVFAEIGGVKLPFFIAAGLSFLNFLYGLFVLPESLPKEKRRNFRWKSANPIGNLIHLSKYQSILALIFSFFIVYIASHAVQSTWSFFTMYRFNWDVGDVGISLAVVGIIVAVVQGGLVKIVVKALGQMKTVILGMCLWMVGLFLFSTAFEGWMMYAFLLPYCLGGVATPTLQGLISNQVPENEQGELQGAMTSLISLSAIIGQPAMTYLFYIFSKEDSPVYYPGAAFFAAGILVIISLLLVLKPLRKLTSKAS